MPTELIEQVTADNPRMAEMMQLLSERSSDFRSPLEMRLTAVGMDPLMREAADRIMSDYWSDAGRLVKLARDSASQFPTRDEVIIGSGYHAAVYAAMRVRCGYPRPLVVESSERVGGTFGMTRTPAFYLNSRNRPGRIGTAGDRRAALNALPGATVQASNLSMAEYQTNADMGFVIRLALAENADVLSDTRVISVSTDDDTSVLTVETTRGPVYALRVIDARGLGKPKFETNESSRMYNFPDFMTMMARTTWPLRGMKRVAVLGGGDSAKCAVESLIGVSPQTGPAMALDQVERIDWYANNLPDTCEQWRQQIRGRYQAIGASLRPDRFGERRVNVINARAFPIGLPGYSLIEGRSYDMVIGCTGFQEQVLTGLGIGAFEGFVPDGGNDTVARKDANLEVYRVGPHARLAFSASERNNGVADISNNKVAMFRLGGKTAALAASLPRP